MPRFNFDLIGAHTVHDPNGLIFVNCQAAGRFAGELANDLSALRPELHENASVVMTDERNLLTYCIAILQCLLAWLRGLKQTAEVEFAKHDLEGVAFEYPTIG